MSEFRPITCRRIAAILITASLLNVSCTRDEAKSSPPPPPVSKIVYSKEIDFDRSFALLTGRGTDQRAAGRALAGQYVEWDAYVIGIHDWPPERVEQLKKAHFSSEEQRQAVLSRAANPQQFLIAPLVDANGGIVMRAGTGFAGKGDFGRVIRGYPAEQKLRLRGRVYVSGEGGVELWVNELEPIGAIPPGQAG